MIPLTGTQQLLASDEAVLAMVYRVAKFYSCKYPRYADEFRSAGHWAIVEAARKYIPRGAKFATLVHIIAHRRMADVVRLYGTLKGFRRTPAKPKGYQSQPRVVSFNPRVYEGYYL